MWLLVIGWVVWGFIWVILLTPWWAWWFPVAWIVIWGWWLSRRRGLVKFFVWGVGFMLLG